MNLRIMLKGKMLYVTILTLCLGIGLIIGLVPVLTKVVVGPDGPVSISSESYEWFEPNAFAALLIMCIAVLTSFSLFLFY